MEKELVQGQCEHCGTEYTQHLVVDGTQVVVCPHCHKESDNWDTPNNSQFAPSIVAVTK